MKLSPVAAGVLVFFGGDVIAVIAGIHSTSTGIAIVSGSVLIAIAIFFIHLYRRHLETQLMQG
jgi:hypothetical protein